MVSVLFVDDDTEGLAALRRAYGRALEDWQLCFADDADAALGAIGAGAVDAVVASARMAHMSTARFLRLVKQADPAVARVVLAGPRDRSAMLSALPVVNQCVSRACGPEVLARVVQRTANLSARIHSPGTQAFVAEVGSLPSLPDSLAALDAALADEDCSLAQIAGIVGADVAMTAKVLQLVNSSFFGLRAQVCDLRHAVAYLGVETLRDFAVAGAVFRAFTPSPPLSCSWMSAFARHSTQVGERCARMVRTGSARCEATVAGMLHNIGELVLAERAPARLLAISADLVDAGSPDDAEMRHLGTTLPLVGANLLSDWGMGYHIVEAVACQRHAWEGPARGPELGDLVTVADRATGESRREGPGAGGPELPWVPVCHSALAGPPSPEYLARVGLSGPAGTACEDDAAAGIAG